MLVGRCSSELSGHRLQGKLKSHSLRAKPRDLQFCGLVLEMFLRRLCRISRFNPHRDMRESPDIVSSLIQKF